MTQRSSGMAGGRPRTLVLGLLVAALAVVTAFAVDGTTPEPAAVAGASAEASARSTAEMAPGDANSAASGPPTTPPPGVPSASEPAVGRDFVEGTSDEQASEVPEVSEAVGVPPPGPQPDDAVLGETAQKEKAPVDIDESVEVLDGMTVGLAELVAVEGIADEPGEVAGEAVRVSVTLTNTSTRPADTSGVVVGLEAGPEAVPGLALRGAGATTFPSSIDPGASATADYVFVVDPDQRESISVSVNYSVTAPIAVFDGVAPPAKENR